MSDTFSGAHKIKKELSKIKYAPPPVTSKAASTVGKMALYYIAVCDCGLNSNFSQYYEEVSTILIDFLRKAPEEHKVSGLYLIDSLVK